MELIRIGYSGQVQIYSQFESFDFTSTAYELSLKQGKYSGYVNYLSINSNVSCIFVYK